MLIEVDPDRTRTRSAQIDPPQVSILPWRSHCRSRKLIRQRHKANYIAKSERGGEKGESGESTLP